MHEQAPEIAYLGDLARAWAQGVGGTVPAPAELDSERFMRMVSQQPAMPTLASYIDADAIPTADRSRFDQATEISRRRTVMLLLELERVLPALAEIGCRPVVLKGASLALTVYDRPEDRWFIDLDLLVPAEQLEAVYDCIGRLGYHYADTVAPSHLYDKHHFHRIFVSNQGVCVEIHWALTMPASVYKFDLEAVRRDAIEIPLGNASFLAPSNIDQVLHGVLQSVAGGFGDLRRLLDLHLLDSRLDDDDRHLLCKRALATNAGTGLWLQYRLREDILGAAVPAVIDHHLRPDARLVRILDGLNVADGCLTRRVLMDADYTYLIHWLTVPPRLRVREVRRYLFPDAANCLISGLAQDGHVRAMDRLRTSAWRFLMAGRLLGEVTRAAI